MRFSLDRSRTDKTSRDEALDQLERVAEANGFRVFTMGEFDDSPESTIHSNTIRNTFDKWNLAIDALRERLKTRGIELKTRSRRQYTDQQIFDEMGRIWRHVGHRPSESEWNSCNPKISFNTVRNTFDGWIAACAAFVEHKMGHAIETVSQPPRAKRPSKKAAEPRSRSIPLKTRLAVLQRDNFRCVYCGRSPVTHTGVSLHLDHIKPFSKGGDHSPENLHVLCAECNLGKSNHEMRNNVLHRSCRSGRS